MKIRIFFFMLLISILSCQNRRKIDPRARALHSKAGQIIRNNPTNEDSLLSAMVLIDRAIQIDSSQTNFYFSEFQVWITLRKYDSAINTSNKILAIDANNFLATLGKGVAFDLWGHSDSARNTYIEALEIAESTRFQTLMFKDYEKIILYGLLKDSSNFNLSFKNFKSKYFSEKEFPQYSESLKNFNRAEYLNSW